MQKQRAQIILELRMLGDRIFQFKSPLSRVILLRIASYGGECELRVLMKAIDASPVAVRQHIQSLESERYLTLGTHETNRRCKMVALTDKALALLRQYEASLSDAANRWISEDPPSVPGWVGST